MATTVSGSVVLPNGVAPRNGSIIFTPMESIVDDRVVTAVPVIVPITNNTFSVSLEGVASGTTYTVQVEQFNEVLNTLVTVRLPNIVVTGSGTGTLESLSVVRTSGTASDTMVLIQGETLNVTGQYVNQNLRPESIADVTIRSYLMQNGIRQDLTVTKINAELGTFQITARASINQNLYGTYEWVVAMSAGSQTIIETATLIVKGVE